MNSDSCDAAVSTFCLPGVLYLDNVTNSSPYDPEGTHKFFTHHTHKPMYELSSSLVYEQHLSTGNDRVDSLLKEWFEKLNNKHWNSKQLLLDLFNLLKEINEIVQ